jgi:hypothetical protein
MENDREVEIKEAKNKLVDLLDTELVKKLIENNFYEFEHKEVTYKIRKPTFKDRQEVYKKRCEKQVEFLLETKPDGQFKYLSEKDLKELYKKRGIDIDKMTRKISQLQFKEKELLERLGKFIKENNSEPQLEQLREEIETIRLEIQNTSADKTTLLEFSIENQLLSYIYHYFTFLCSSKKDGENYIPVWKTIEDLYNTDDEELVNKLNTYMAMLINVSNV